MIWLVAMQEYVRRTTRDMLILESFETRRLCDFGTYRSLSLIARYGGLVFHNMSISLEQR